MAVRKKRQDRYLCQRGVISVFPCQSEQLFDLVFPRFSDDWNHVASRPKRSMNSIVLDEGVKELLLEDARDFLKSKQWYADRGTSLL